MPWPSPPEAEHSPEELRQHYEIETALALELCRADRTERARLYGAVYDRLFRQVPGLARGAGAASRAREVELQAQALAPFLGPDLVLLELGAGDCALALQLASRVGRVHAVEASAEASRGVQPPDNLDLVLSGDPRLPLADGSVDVAYSCHFIEHLHPEDAREHADEVRRVLARQGCYVCVTPNRLWGPHDISRFFDDEPRGLHLREYGYGDLRDLLRGAGFRRIAALRGVGRPPRAVAPTPYVALEAVLDAMPRRLRRWLMGRWPGALAEAPFRPLEQVALVAWV